MAGKQINLTLITSAQALKRTLSVDEAREMLEQAVPAWELHEALEVLEMEAMEEGFYIGSNWTVSFRAAEALI